MLLSVAPLLFYITLNTRARADQITVPEHIIDAVNRRPEFVFRYACHWVGRCMAIVAAIPVGVADIV